MGYSTHSLPPRCSHPSQMEIFDFPNYSMWGRSKQWVSWRKEVCAHRRGLRRLQGAGGGGRQQRRQKTGAEAGGMCVVSLQQLRQGPVLKAQAGMLHPSSRAPLLPGRPLCTLTAKPSIVATALGPVPYQYNHAHPGPLKRNCSPRFTVLGRLMLKRQV